MQNSLAWKLTPSLHMHRQQERHPGRQLEQTEGSSLERGRDRDKIECALTLPLTTYLKFRSTWDVNSPQSELKQ